MSPIDEIIKACLETLEQIEMGKDARLSVSAVLGLAIQAKVREVEPDNPPEKPGWMTAQARQMIEEVEGNAARSG